MPEATVEYLNCFPLNDRKKVALLLFLCPLSYLLYMFLGSSLLLSFPTFTEDRKESN